MAKKTENLSATAFDLISDYLGEIAKEVGASVNKGLENATDYLVEELKATTPVGTNPERAGTTKNAWVAEKKYNNVKYINNTALNDRDMPIVNLLEFGKKGKPFVRRTLDKSRNEIERLIKEELEKENGE